MKRTIATVILYLFFHSISFSQIVLNEVCTKNNTLIEDEFGETPDWIELYNNSNSDFNLEGYFLSDDIDELLKWEFPNKTIAAQSVLLVFASGNDLADIYCHTNFKLSNLGEKIFLSDANGNLVDEISIPNLNDDHSFGRLPDGNGAWTFFEIPTPQDLNTLGTNYDFAKSPTLNTQQYFYGNSTTIGLSCDDPNCSIRFTRDGTIPDLNSELYTEPISIDTTTCIRAVTFSSDFSPSTPTTRTIFINSEHTLPILSMTSEPHNLFDWEDGIFTLGPTGDSIFPHWGANFWKDIEVPMHIEYFIDDNLEAEYDVGAKVHGGKAARSKAMKAIRLVTDGDYPSEGMDYQFFKNKDIHHFTRLVVRNASGDFNYTHFRDAYLHRYFIDEGLDLDVLGHQPMAIYLNGMYWGVMNMREKIDRFYIANNNGYPRDSIDLLEEDLFVLEGSGDEYNSNFEFITTNDLNIESNFEIAKSYYDISNLADYYICQSFVNNTDFPNNNIKFWQPNNENGKWRHLLFDMDVAMGRFGWTVAHFDNFNWLLRDNPTNNRFVNIVKALLSNDEYRDYFITRYADLMNTVFREEILKAETERTVAEIEDEMERHFQVWEWPGFDVWSGRRLGGLFTFIEERPGYQREFVREYFELENSVQLKINTFPKGAGTIQVNTITPDELPWDGHYYNGVPVTLTIVPNNGFTFSHWESIHTFLDKDISQSISYNYEVDDEITAYFEAEYDGLNIAASPNPFQNEINIDFTLDQISTVDIKIYDSVGKLIHQFNNGKMNGGTHHIPLKINSLQNGFYIISIQTEYERESIKVFKAN